MSLYQKIDLSILVVSYNTRDLTLACLESVYMQTSKISFEVLVVDNNSTDGSAEAVSRRFPQMRLFAQEENLGFAAANNLAAGQASGEWLLLLNPDTVVHMDAITNLVDFARQNPVHRIYGGRTFFEDGSLNPASCWGRITLWSMFCHAFGLSSLFRRSALFDSEGLGSWQRDTVREVDIVSGCFLLIRRDFWNRLGGFDPAFFMYGEEADLCRRAQKLGARPVICPDARIMHYGGRSERARADKLVRLLGARRRLISRHWRPCWVSVGKALQDLAVLNRLFAARLVAALRGRFKSERGTFQEVWARRHEWRNVAE